MSTEPETPREAGRAGGGAGSSADPSVDQTEATPAAPDTAPTSSADWARIQDELRQLRTELAETRASLAEAQERADRYHANWQRSAADFLNWKRRADQEKTDATRLGEATVIADLLRVTDDFERAFAALPPELRGFTWIEGVYMIWNKTLAIFESRGLTPIEALGRDFDPREHEAVMREEDGDPSEQTAVVAELQRGYRFHDRVLRPTLVKVGRPRPAGADAGAPGGQAGGTSEATTATGGAGAAPDATESAPTVG